MLDAQAGIQYEGETPPPPTDDDVMAIRVFNGLANGMGGLDWAGLPLLCAYHGVRDVEGLLHRLLVIKAHRKPDDADRGAVTDD